MMKLDKDKRASWGFMAVLIVVNLVYLFVFFLPGKNEIAGMRGEIQAVEQFLAFRAARQAEINVVQEKLGIANDYTSQWRKAATPSDGIATLFSEINRRAGSAGVAVSRFEPREVSEMEHLDRISLHLGAEGSFPEVFQLLGELEQLTATVWIDSMHLRAGRGSLPGVSPETDGASVQSEINLAIFAAKSEDSD